MKQIFALILTLVCFFSKFALSDQAKLSLREALEFAMEHSPKLDSARRSLQLRDLEVRSALAKMLPSIDVSAGIGLRSGQLSTSPSLLPGLNSSGSSPLASSLGLELTENLYDNGASWIQYRVAQANQKAAELLYRKTRDELIQSVCLEFHRYSQMTAFLEVRSQKKDGIERQLRMLSAQYQQGLKPKNDFLRLKTQFQSAEIDVLSARNNIGLSQTELRKLLGVALDAQVSPEFQPIRVQSKSRLEDLLPKSTLSIENTYDAKLAKLQMEINEGAVKTAKRSYLPRATVNGGISYQNFNFLGSQQSFEATGQFSWSLLLSLQYNLWDWGIRRRELQAAQTQLEIQSNTLNQGLQEIQSQLVSLQLDAKRLLQSVRLSQELLGLEESANAHLEEQYRQGKASYLDYITSLNSLLDARVNIIVSYFEILNLRVKHYTLDGKIFEVAFEK